MSEGERDPIQTEGPEALDTRFARIRLQTGNAPQDPDGSLVVRGAVDLGERTIHVASGRAYRVAIGFLTLNVEESGCDYAPNRGLEAKAQNAVFKETEKARSGSKVSANAKASARVSDKSGAGAFDLGGGLEAQASQEVNSERRYDCYRARCVASGWELGDRRLGDPHDREGVLKGVWLDGLWGTLTPRPGVRKYGALFRLLLPQGALRVLAHDEGFGEWFSDMATASDGDARRRAAAFEALRGAVAGWAVETMRDTSSHPEGFDRDRKELVLAHVGVAVDLTAMAPVADQPALAAPSCAGTKPALAAPGAQAPPTRKTARRASKAGAKAS